MPNSESMSSTATHVDQLERVLLRRGVGALEADRHSCADCGRTPLTGEHVHVYDERIVCALCRPRRREAPLATELVRHCEHGYTVRLTASAA
jgi:recombinational DNA repair protein (RecF pathway)